MKRLIDALYWIGMHRLIITRLFIVWLLGLAITSQGMSLSMMLQKSSTAPVATQAMVMPCHQISDQIDDATNTTQQACHTCHICLISTLSVIHHTLTPLSMTVTQQAYRQTTKTPIFSKQYPPAIRPPIVV